MIRIKTNINKKYKKIRKISEESYFSCKEIEDKLLDMLKTINNLTKKIESVRKNIVDMDLIIREIKEGCK